MSQDDESTQQVVLTLFLEELISSAQDRVCALNYSFSHCSEFSCSPVFYLHCSDALIRAVLWGKCLTQHRSTALQTLETMTIQIAFKTEPFLVKSIPYVSHHIHQTSKRSERHPSFCHTFPV